MLVLPMNWTFVPANKMSALSDIASLVSRTTGRSFDLTTMPVAEHEKAHNVHDSTAAGGKYSRALDDDIDEETQKYMRATFFEPDAQLLGGLLSTATARGLVVGGDASGKCATAQGCYEYLSATW